MTKKQKKEARQNGKDEKTMTVGARQLRGIFNMRPDDADHEDTENARKELQKKKSPAMPCVARQETKPVPIVREATLCSLQEATLGSFSYVREGNPTRSNKQER